VSRSILNPLATTIRGAKVLFLSPDGEFNRVPFAALPAPGTSQVLAETVQLRLLTTGRDLLDLQQPSATSKAAPLVVAHPRFDAPGRPAGGPIRGDETGQQRSADLKNPSWSPLPATAREGQAIASLTKGRLLLQEQATAAAVQQQPGPKILHIASHAFFLADQPQKPEPLAPVSLTRSAASPFGLPASKGENPLLRSGIALAGANAPAASATDDGYLMALEIAQLDWKGTELVVISACESGKGVIQAGEGVYGLRRAIAVAGARSSLLSLWKVDDAATADFMTRYYSRLKAGEGRADAIAAVQAEFRNGTAGNGQWKESYYWAAWQLVGDWRPIQGL
jgi:CHAT domain-containing protein